MFIYLFIFFFWADDELTEVSGVLTSEGLFDGHITTPNELYYLEPASRFVYL